MKGDFTRNSFDPNKHYSRVRMQQGRVQLDADWNEQMDMMDYRNQLFTEDFLGAAMAPSSDAGFEITTQSNPVDLTIGVGRYYVNGLLAENTELASYQAQPDYPGAKLPSYNANNPNNNIYLAYLDIWQRNVSMVNDPTIAEVALNGADTAVRTQNLAQVKLMSVLWDGSLEPLTYNNLFNIHAPVGSDPYQNAVNWQTLQNRLIASSTSQLTPKLNPVPTLTNQLYRVEIHQGSGGGNAPSFKWSRDNACVSAAITTINVDPNGKNSSITIANTVQDGQLGFNLEQWLELTTRTRELTGQPGDMVQIVAINGTTLTVEGKIDTDILPINSAIAYRWESTAVDITLDAVNNLENGLSVIFPLSGTDFSTGDYWLIPVRAATNTIIWPQENNIFQTQFPQGIQSYYAPLAILQCNADNSWTRTDDCRHIATPVSRLDAYGADSEAPSSSVYVDRLGQVGLGTQTPASKLDVEGGLTVNGPVNLSGVSTINGQLSVTPVANNTGISVTAPGYGVSATCTATTASSAGILGSSSQSYGVVGRSTSSIGMYGISESNYGVLGSSTSGVGVCGQSSNYIGVYGHALNDAIWGVSEGNIGVYGYSKGTTPGAHGVYGQKDDITGNQGYGVYATTLHVEHPNVGLFSYIPKAGKVSVADPSGRFTSNWLGDTWVSNNPTELPFFMPAGFQVIPLNGQLYVFYENTVLKYDPIQNNWTTLASLNTARTFFGCATVDNTIYLMGGLDSDGNLLKSVESYETTSTKSIWKKTTALTIPRHNFSTAVVGTKIYVTGGEGENGTVLDSIEAFDTMNSDLGWQAVAPLNSPRQGHSTCVVDGVIYVIGGICSDSLALSTVEIYDTHLHNPAWILQATTLQTPRWHGSVSAVGNKIYAMGGNNETGILDHVELFDITLPEEGWQTLLRMATLPFARQYLQSAFCKNKIFVLGSYYDNTNPSTVMGIFLPIHYPSDNNIDSAT